MTLHHTAADAGASGKVLSREMGEFLIELAIALALDQQLRARHAHRQRGLLLQQPGRQSGDLPAPEAGETAAAPRRPRGEGRYC